MTFVAGTPRASGTYCLGESLHIKYSRIIINYSCVYIPATFSLSVSSFPSISDPQNINNANSAKLFRQCQIWGFPITLSLCYKFCFQFDKCRRLRGLVCHVSPRGTFASSSGRWQGRDSGARSSAMFKIRKLENTWQQSTAFLWSLCNHPRTHPTNNFHAIFVSNELFYSRFSSLSRLTWEKWCRLRAPSGKQCRMVLVSHTEIR